MLPLRLDHSVSTASRHCLPDSGGEPVGCLDDLRRLLLQNKTPAEREGGREGEAELRGIVVPINAHLDDHQELLGELVGEGEELVSSDEVLGQH